MLPKVKKPKDDAAKKPVKKAGVTGKTEKSTTPKPSVASKKTKDSAETEEKKTSGVAKKSLKKETLLDGRSASVTAKKTSKKSETEPEKVERSAASAPGVKSTTKKTSTTSPTAEKKVTKPKTGASKSPAPALEKKSLTEKKPKTGASKSPAPALEKKSLTEKKPTKATGELEAATGERKSASKKAETKGLARNATPPVPKPSLAKKLATKVLTPKGSGSEEKEKKTKEKSTLATKVRSSLQRLSSKKTKSEAPSAKTESPASTKTSTPKGKSARATLRPSQSPAPLPKERRKSASDVSSRTLSVASGKSSSSGVGAKKKGTKKKDTTPSVASTLSPPPSSDHASEDVSQLDSEALSTEIGIESKNDESVVLTEGGLSYRSTLSSDPVEANREVEKEQIVDMEEDSKSHVSEEEAVVVDEPTQGPKQPRGPIAQEMEPPTTMSTRSHSATPRDSRSVSREDDDDDQTLAQVDASDDAKMEEIKQTEQERALDFEEADERQTAAVEKEEEADVALNVSEDKERGIDVSHVQEPEGIKNVTPPKQEDVLVASIGTTQDALMQQHKDEIVKEEDIGSHAKAEDDVTGAGHRRILSCWSTMNEVAEEDRNQRLEEEEDAETLILEMHDEKSDQATVDHPELNTMSTLDEVFEQILDEGGFDTRSQGGFSSDQAGASAGGSMDERNAEVFDGFSELSGEPDLPPRSDLDENQTPPAVTPQHRTPELGTSPSLSDLSGAAAGVGEREFFGDDFHSSDDGLSLPDEVAAANEEWAARVASETGNALSEATHSQGLDSWDRHDSSHVARVEQEVEDETRDFDSLSDLSLPEEVIEDNAARMAAREEQPEVVREVQANVQEAAPAAHEVEARSLPADMVVERSQQHVSLSAPDTAVVTQVPMETNSPAPAEVHATRAFEKDEGLLQKDDAPMSTAPQVEQSTAKDSLSHPEEALDVQSVVEEDRLSQEALATPREDAHEDLSTPDENMYGEKTENDDDASLPDTVNAAGSGEDDISLSEILALPENYEADELSTPGRTPGPQTDRSQPYDARTSEDLMLSDWPSDDAVPSESGCDTSLGSLPDPDYLDDDDGMPPKGGVDRLPQRSRSSFEGMSGAPVGATSTTTPETTTQPPPPPSQTGLKDHSTTDTCDPRSSLQEDPVHDDVHEDPLSHAEPSDPPCKAHHDDSSGERNSGNRRRGRGRTIVTWAVSVLGVAVTVIFLTQRGH